MYTVAYRVLIRRTRDTILGWYPCSGSQAVWKGPEKSSRTFAYHFELLLLDPITFGFSVLNGSN